MRLTDLTNAYKRAVAPPSEKKIEPTGEQTPKKEAK